MLPQDRIVTCAVVRQSQVSRALGLHIMLNPRYTVPGRVVVRAMPLGRASISGRARRFDTRCSRIGAEESQAGRRICFASLPPWNVCVIQPPNEKDDHVSVYP